VFTGATRCTWRARTRRRGYSVVFVSQTANPARPAPSRACPPNRCRPRGIHRHVGSCPPARVDAVLHNLCHIGVDSDTRPEHSRRVVSLPRFVHRRAGPGLLDEPASRPRTGLSPNSGNPILFGEPSIPSRSSFPQLGQVWTAAGVTAGIDGAVARRGRLGPTRRRRGPAGGAVPAQSWRTYQFAAPFWMPRASGADPRRWQEASIRTRWRASIPDLARPARRWPPPLHPGVHRRGWARRLGATVEMISNAEAARRTARGDRRHHDRDRGLPLRLSAPPKRCAGNFSFDGWLSPRLIQYAQDLP